ncbi:MAG: lipoyl(octanoyl) transferase LipB [Acidobacteria bacterium]|nr:lipoyl(octanoyl) transferase LipB [Acidobacteriota bacterium]
MKAEPYMTMTHTRTLHVRRLGRMEYGAALKLQKETELAVRDGAQQPDTLLLVEHPHVLTLGRRASASALLAAPEELAARGVIVCETNRGGKITYHGDGQLVGYPVINLSPEREDVHRYVRDLEEALIRTLADFQIEGFRIKGLTGVHTTTGKVAAIGVHIARWVTTHGFALNINTDLSFFDLIIACEGEPVTSMQELVGRSIEMRLVEDRVIARFADVFEMTPEEGAPQEIEAVHTGRTSLPLSRI